MSRTHILLIFLLLPLTLRSQEDICIGKELVLYSTVIARRPELLDKPAGAL